jgi:2,3-bisphosphoglycerate-independent phosphoglycerate mutase
MVKKKYVIVIPDGAPDLHRSGGLSPMAAAGIPMQDWLAEQGVCGRMRTQYEDLPRGSIVAQLGMLGWDPRAFRCHARSAWELQALGTVDLHRGDLAFRANLVRMQGRRLMSYNADFILSSQAEPLVNRLNAELKERFPEFELHHNNDFRNSLLIRGVGLDPLLFDSPEPHENEGVEFEIGSLLKGHNAASQAVADRINKYITCAAELLGGEQANMLFPWSAGCPISLPSFQENTGFDQRVAIVGCMDFLRGIASAAEIEFFRVGNGRPDTDYAAKGKKTIELLEQGFSLVICHVNAPDEAAHMRDRELKIRCLEAIDREVVGPLVEYFRPRMADLGGLIVAPDHYTNLLLGGTRVDAHSLDPVPFLLWNGSDRDGTVAFHEDAVMSGRWGTDPISHLDLLRVLGVNRLSAVTLPAGDKRA